ncbi:hypothetical protein EYR36_004939 [Pleurotus pulmonarius]|nr:hypothetical protein EYR36_004939 [Pleurotus pulmonarius]
MDVFDCELAASNVESRTPHDADITHWTFGSRNKENDQASQYASTATNTVLNAPNGHLTFHPAAPAHFYQAAPTPRERISYENVPPAPAHDSQAYPQSDMQPYPLLYHLYSPLYATGFPPPPFDSTLSTPLPLSAAWPAPNISGPHQGATHGATERPSKRRQLAHPSEPQTPTPDARRALRDTSTHNVPQPPSRSSSLRRSPMSDEDKIKQVLVAIKDCRFQGLGHFLATLFNPAAAYSNQTTVQALTSFLGSASSPGQSPTSIVQAWIKHPRSQLGSGTDLCDLIPTYAHPIEFDLPSASGSDSDRAMGARRSLKRLAVKITLGLVEEETEALIGEKSFRPPKDWSWDVFRKLTMKSLQKKLMTLAPVIWSFFLALSVSPNRREHIAEVREQLDLFTKDSPEYSKLIDSINDVPHNPWSACAFLIMVALSLHNHLISLVPNMISVLLFMTNAGRLVYRFLGRFGISAAYGTTLRHLHQLGINAGMVLEDLGAGISETKGHFIILFDNINKHHRAWHQSISNADEVKSGMAATIIKMHAVPGAAMSSAKYKEKLMKGDRKKLDVKRLREDIDSKHIAAIGQATLLKIWADNIPSLNKYSTRVNKQFEGPLAKHCIPLHKTDIYPLRTSGIDESTTAGNSDVLRDITHTQMKMSDTDFEHILIPVAGDQLTVDRVRKLISYTVKDVSPYARHTWALPFIQLWHMKWAFLKAIYKARWDPSQGKRVFGLHRDCESMGHMKLNPTKCDFHDHDAAVKETFEVSCLGILRVLLDEQQGREATPPQVHTTCTKKNNKTKLVASLDRFFTANGCFHTKPFSFVEDLARAAYRRYMCTAAYEAALGDIPRDEAVYGAMGTTFEPTEEETGEDLPEQWKGDRVLANFVLRLRDCLWYYELYHAISDGDIGRVMEIIKILRFYFLGSGSTNYGNELLELACNQFYEFPDSLWTALLNNWLEHHNLFIKTLFNDRNSDFDSPFLQEVVALNVREFSKLRQFISSFFHIKIGSGKHTDPDPYASINALGSTQRDDDIFCFHSGRTQSWIAPDFFAQGYNKLASGHLDVFKEHTLSDSSSVQPETE